MLKLKFLLAKIDTGNSVIGYYLSAVLARITSQELVNWVSILVGVLTAIKIILDIKSKKKNG
jgi:uncharacterized membrane protein YfcA